MSKGTSCKDALKKWSETNGTPSTEAEEIKLICELPCIDKMDTSLLTLANCVQLSLSSNAIDKIANLNGLKKLKILVLSRNNIKNLNGLDAVGDTLEQLWISNNNIEKLKGVHVLKKLKVLYIANNGVKDWAEFTKLADLQELEDLSFYGNPIYEQLMASGEWVQKASAALPQIKKLDSAAVIRD